MLYTGAVTLAAIGLYFFLATRVAVARRRLGVTLPATNGHPDFDRIFRVHQNTLEWLPTFLAPLWLCAFTLGDVIAASIGVFWVIGRAVYAYGYSRSVQGRLPGFFIQALACSILFLCALVGVGRGLVTG
jgi:glutathione S-transferase